MSKNLQEKAALQCETVKAKRKKRRILLCIGIVIAIVVVGVLIWIDSQPTKLCISQPSSNSAGQYWTCELSTNDVIKEIKYEKNFLEPNKSGFLNR